MREDEAKVGETDENVEYRGDEGADGAAKAAFYAGQQQQQDAAHKEEDAGPDSRTSIEVRSTLEVDERRRGEDNYSSSY